LSIGLFLPVRYNTTLSRYSVNKVVPSGTSYYNIVRIQRQSGLFLPVRYITTLLRYSVIQGFSFRYVIL